MKLNILPFLAFLLLTAQSYGQEGSCIVVQKEGIWHNYQLKGPVKSMRWFYTHIKEGLTKHQQFRVVYKNEVRQRFYTEFNKFGLITKSLQVSKSPQLRDMPIDSATFDIYVYDEKDLAEKLSYTLCNNTQSSLVDNHSQFLKVNQSVVSGFAKLIIQDIYKYECDDKGRLKNEIYYAAWRNYDTIIDRNDVVEDDIYYWKTFIYDEQDNIISIRTKGGKASEMMLTYYDFGTEGDLSCEDLQINFDYDDRGRITRGVLINCDETEFEQSYVYHPDLGYVMQINTEYSDMNPGLTSPKKTAYYNEKGDVTEVNFFKFNYSTNTWENPVFIEKEVAANHYYKYEYDSYNNWIKCYYYLEGTKEGEPSAISERVIEYYKD